MKTWVQEAHLLVKSIGVGTGGAAGAVAPATIKLGGGGDIFSSPPNFLQPN